MLTENRLTELGKPKLVILPAPQALTECAWQNLLAYAEHGGCLLVTGPLQHDEHWQEIDRLAPLKVQARNLPLSVRQSTLQLPGKSRLIQVTYPTSIQQAPIQAMRFADGSSVKIIGHGAGKIVWAADPVEFAENYEPTAALYSYALQLAGVSPAFRRHCCINSKSANLYTRCRR